MSASRGLPRWERLAGSPQSELTFSCEHASNHLPEPWSWPEEDAHLVDDHWAWDPGAEALTRALASRFRAPALLARCTRLLVDLNRPLESPTLFRDVADGRPVRLNQGLSDDQRRRRIEAWYEPYHTAYDAMVREHPKAWLLVSVHSYTPEYEGSQRQVEVGVLWDDDEALGKQVLAFLQTSGHDVRANEPWSGKNGLMHSVQQQATLHSRRAVEFEVRQDLLESVEGVEAMAELLAPALAHALDRRSQV